MPLPTLTFRPHILEKVWGGLAFASLGKVLPNPNAKPHARFGESWEIADMSSTSSSGAGGGAFRSVIDSGPLEGQTLHDALSLWGDELIARELLTPDANFPLLFKLLDANEHLSVQVHPSPAYARATPGANLKTECWYILDAKPDAELFVGVKPDVSPSAFAKLARGGDPAIVEAMVRRPAIPGELHNLPSGVIHALGAGVLVAEVQTPSDTTYRLYDWGRAGRELHIEQALAAATFDAAPAPTRRSSDEAEAVLVRTPFFVVRELPIPAHASARPITHENPGAPVILMGVSGTAILESQGGLSTKIVPGQTALVPASSVAKTRIHCGGLARTLCIEPRREA